MATRIIHRRGKGIPAASEFASVGEILIDTDTGTGYTLREPDGAVVALGGDGSGGDSAGAGMVISETEPVDKVDGMQWLEADTGLVFIWDEDKWLQFPAGSEGGSSSGGGGAWELLEVFDITGATAIDYPDCGKEYSAYKLECSHLYVSSTPFNLHSNVYINGALSNGGSAQNVYDRSVFDPLDASQSFSGESFFQHSDQLGVQKTGLYSFEIVYSGFTLGEEPNRSSRSPALISSTVNFDADQRRQVTVGKARLEPADAEFTGFQLFVRGHDRGKVYLSGLRG